MVAAPGAAAPRRRRIAGDAAHAPAPAPGAVRVVGPDRAVAGRGRRPDAHAAQPHALARAARVRRDGRDGRRQVRAALRAHRRADVLAGGRRRRRRARVHAATAWAEAGTLRDNVVFAGAGAPCDAGRFMRGRGRVPRAGLRACRSAPPPSSARAARHALGRPAPPARSRARALRARRRGHARRPARRARRQRRGASSRRACSAARSRARGARHVSSRTVLADAADVVVLGVDAEGTAPSSTRARPPSCARAACSARAWTATPRRRRTRTRTAPRPPRARTTSGRRLGRRRRRPTSAPRRTTSAAGARRPVDEAVLASSSPSAAAAPAAALATGSADAAAAPADGGARPRRASRSRVPWRVYTSYARAAGGRAAALGVGACALADVGGRVATQACARVDVRPDSRARRAGKSVLARSRPSSNTYSSENLPALARAPATGTRARSCCRPRSSWPPCSRARSPPRRSRGARRAAARRAARRDAVRAAVVARPPADRAPAPALQRRHARGRRGPRVCHQQRARARARALARSLLVLTRVRICAHLRLSLRSSAARCSSRRASR